jgi:hypothetical protein
MGIAVNSIVWAEYSVGLLGYIILCITVELAPELFASVCSICTEPRLRQVAHNLLRTETVIFILDRNL